MIIKVVLERGENGYFVAHCPTLKSCWSQGETRDEALKNIREAIELYLGSDKTSELPANAEIIEPDFDGGSHKLENTLLEAVRGPHLDWTSQDLEDIARRVKSKPAK